MHRSSANSQGLRLRQIHRLSPPSAPWPTRRRAENLWKRIHSVVDWSSFKTLSNQYHKLILSSKKGYYPNLVFSVSDNPKRLWQTVNNSCSANPPHRYRPLNCLGTSLADSFASFFHMQNIQTTSVSHRQSCYIISAFTFLLLLLHPDFSVFTHALDSKIHRILSNCPNRQSHSDHIPTWLLKECSSELVSTVTNIVNLPHISGWFGVISI